MDSSFNVWEKAIPNHYIDEDAPVVVLDHPFAIHKRIRQNTMSNRNLALQTISNQNLSDVMWHSSLQSIHLVLRRKGAREWRSSRGSQYTEDFQNVVAKLLNEDKVPQTAS
jgi:hypothetical protein